MDARVAFLHPVFRESILRTDGFPDSVDEGIVVLRGTRVNRDPVFREFQDLGEFGPALATKGVGTFGSFRDAKFGDDFALQLLPSDQGPFRKDAGTGNDQIRIFGASEIGASEIGSLEIGASEIGASEIGALEIGALEIVFAGPLYKLFKRQRGEDMEQATIEFTEIIDELRVRYGFAIMLEHHAAKGKDGHRELVPFGSSVFLRWPEFGLTMEPIGPVEPNDENYTLKLGRFRRDRERADWPDDIERRAGAKVPWIPMFERARGTRLGLVRHPIHGEWVPIGSF
jgi:hypothetical protein